MYQLMWVNAFFFTKGHLPMYTRSTFTQGVVTASENKLARLTYQNSFYGIVVKNMDRYNTSINNMYLSCNRIYFDQRMI